jgi:phosphoribosylamine--glycine ligase
VFMNILIIGSGGREHALGWKIAQSGDCGKLYFAPGNAGTTKLGANINIAVTDIEDLACFAESHVDFTVVGPELSLSLGAADVFRKRGLKVFGPDKNAARLETSKAYAKGFMKRYGIPTAAYDVFDRAEDALESLPARAYPLWVKADGLAAGKGALFCADETAARNTVLSLMKNQSLGAAANRVVLEEHMDGREVSLLCITDGHTMLAMDSARDFQRAFDNDAGPNTGGMGCISPVPDFLPGSADNIVRRTLAGIIAEGFDYRGIVYIGLMLTGQGPKVVEYNARFGDPEAQVLLPRMESDLLEALLAAEERKLAEIHLRWKPQPAVCVAIASGGYPDEYTTGYKIKNIPGDTAESVLFHAGTALRDGAAVTSGGRVFTAAGWGADSDAARKNAYDLAGKVLFKDMHYRKDIK